MTTQRLMICQACGEYVPAAGLGACKQIRDPSERVCAERFERVLRKGTCPMGCFEELNRGAGPQALAVAPETQGLGS